LIGRPVVCSLAVAVLLVTSAAAAQEPSEGEKKAAAQALFDEARQLTSAGKYGEACPKFLESKRLDPSMGTKFYLADCFEHVGKLASAWTYYLEAADAARTVGQKDREKFADERAEALKPRLAKLAIKVPDALRGIAGLSIQRDGTAVGEPQWGSAIPVDLGTHVVAATAPGRKPVEVKVEATAESQVVEVIVPPLDPAAAPPGPTVKAAVGPPPPPPPPPASSGRRTAGFVVGAVGIAGVAVGAGLGVLAIQKKNQSNTGNHCDSADTCDSTGLALRSAGLAAANGSDVGFILGALAIGGGIVLVATAPSGGAAVVPAVTVGPGSASLSWRW
jgi:hypothetical protein